MFYAGSVSDELSFVYDCGTAGGSEILGGEISELNFIFDSRKIDFVIISDLNRAYFNGLPELCKRFNVDRLYLPYLGKNKEFIRLAIADAVFREAGDSLSEEKLRLYGFMCRLYGVESRAAEDLGEAMPERVVILGGSDGGASKISADNTAVIRRFNEAEDSALWTFFIINKSLDQEGFDKIEQRLFEAFGGPRSFKSGQKGNFEEYLLGLAGSREGIEKLHGTFTEISGDAKGKTRLSSNMLVHYPLKPLGNIYLCEYKNMHESYLQSMHEKIDGKITVLLGDAFVDKKLEAEIFNCGNFSGSGGILLIPYNVVSDNRTDIISLARPFKTFVSPAGAGEAERVYKRAVIKQVTYPNKPLHLATQSTGVLYFIG